MLQTTIQRKPPGPPRQRCAARAGVRGQGAPRARDDGAVQCANRGTGMLPPLSGAHHTEANINATFPETRQQTFPQAGGDGNLAPFNDRTPDAFDNAYYTNLVAQRGLLHSDQELFNDGSQDALMRKYNGNGKIFVGDCTKAMDKRGGLMPADSGQVELQEG